MGFLCVLTIMCYFCIKPNKHSIMEATEQTSLQTERFLRKIAEKFPPCDEASIMTDIHVYASQESGELIAFDDGDREITRCVVEQWIGNEDEHFYDHAARILREGLKKCHQTIDKMGIMKPFSFVLEDEEKTFIAELYVSDDDTVILGGDLMEGLNQDLDLFFDNLFKE